MNELHLLDILAARHGCFISDLNLSPILRRAALLDLCRMGENGYPPSPWRDTGRYLTGGERGFFRGKEIQTIIQQGLEAGGRTVVPQKNHRPVIMRSSRRCI